MSAACLRAELIHPCRVCELNEKSMGSSNRRPRVGMVSGLGRGVSSPHRGLGPPRNFSEFSSKNAGFCAFLLQKLLVKVKKGKGTVSR